MDVDAVDGGRELREAIEARFGRAPVVLLGPVRADLLPVGEGYALRPIAQRLRVRPACRAQTSLQIDELILRDVDAERSNVAHRSPIMRVASSGLPTVCWRRPQGAFTCSTALRWSAAHRPGYTPPPCRSSSESSRAPPSARGRGT